MNDKIENIIHLIQESPLDDTIKEILIRDLRQEGLLRCTYHQKGIRVIPPYHVHIQHCNRAVEPEERVTGQKN